MPVMRPNAGCESWAKISFSPSFLSFAFFVVEWKEGGGKKRGWGYGRGCSFFLCFVLLWGGTAFITCDGAGLVDLANLVTL